jgi:predicted dehydrogenase
MNKIKAGIIGCGFIAKARHIPAFKKMKNSVELCAVCDLNETLAKDAASEFHIPHAYSTTEAMFAREDLDLVDICVPPQIHAAVATEAMNNGCNVIMEKPMALTMSDCDQMLAASQKYNVKLCTIHNDLFHAPFLKARRLIDAGAIGDFRGMRIFFSTPRNDMIDLQDHWYHKLPGGVIGETGPHISYMSAAFLGEITKTDVYAKNFLAHSWAPFDEFRIELEGENGFSSVALSYTNNYWAAEVDLIGSNAMLHLDLERMLLIRQRLDSLGYASVGNSSLSVLAQMTKSVVSNAFKGIVGKHKLGTTVVIEQFVDSVMHGTPTPITGKEGAEAVRIMEMVVARYNEKYGHLLRQE